MNHKMVKIVGGSIAIAATLAFVTPSHHVGPDFLYPDPKLTPGVMATQDINELTATNPTYSQAHRKTTEAMKRAVCKEYPSGCTVKAEVDHFCPLALGCADDVKNLWEQPETNLWNGINYGFHQKDALEAYLARAVKIRTITPKDAQDCIIQDWVRCYQQYIKPIAGAVSTTDPDD